MNSPTDWAAIAKARGIEMADAELEVAAHRLRTLEAAFRPLALRLMPDQEPAVVFRADGEEE